MKAVKENKKILLYCCIVFFFFLVVGFLIPYTGDDWNNLMHNGALKTILRIAIDNYKTFEGRFFSRILVLIMNYYKPLWIVINALFMTFMYYFIITIIKPKRSKIMYPFILLALLLLDEETFSQIYVWITGSVTYFFPMIFVLFNIYINRYIFTKDKLKDYPKFYYVLLPILSFICSMFVENISVALITSYLLIIIYHKIKYKKLNWLMIINTIFSITGLLLMLNSPGTKGRMDTMIAFSNMNFIEKILYTIPRQFNYIFIKNSFLVFCLVLLSFFFIKDNIKGLKRIILILFMSILPIITLLSNVYYIAFRYLPKPLLYITNCYNIPILIYWFIFMIMICYLVIKYHHSDKDKLLFFFSIGVINHLSMLLSPLAGGRTTFFSTIMLFICLFIIMDKMKCSLLDNKILTIIVKLGVLLLIVVFTIFYIYCHLLDVKRTNYINKQLASKNKKIEIIMLPGVYLWNANPWDSWHMHTFKYCYKIPKKIKTEIKKIKECNI